MMGKREKSSRMWPRVEKPRDGDCRAQRTVHTQRTVSSGVLLEVMIFLRDGFSTSIFDCPLLTSFERML